MPVFIIINLVILQILLVFVHLATYGTLVLAFGEGSALVRGLFVILAFTFIVSSFLSHLKKGRWIDIFYTFSAYWFGLVHFLFMGGVVFFFLLRGFYEAGIYVNPSLLGGLCFAVLFLVHLYGTLASGRGDITRIEAALPGLPDAWKGKKVVFVSDIHLGSIRRMGFAARVAREIMLLKPEAIFVGGDLYDGTACDPAKIAEPFRALRAPHGVYFITGNHEYYLPKEDFAAAMTTIKDLGMRILDNETIDMAGITLAGVADRDVHKKSDFEKVLKGMPSFDRSRASIILKHEPKYLDVAKDAGFSLLLAGHTHRGQIFPLNYITRTLYQGFDYGAKKLGEMLVYTSSGVGTWGPPLRLGTKSEIVEITLL